MPHMADKPAFRPIRKKLVIAFEKFETTDVVTYFGHGFLRFVAEYVPGEE